MKFIVSPNGGSNPIVCTNLIQLSNHTGVPSSYLKSIMTRHTKDKNPKFKVNRVDVQIIE